VEPTSLSTTVVGTTQALVTPLLPLRPTKGKQKWPSPGGGRGNHSLSYERSLAIPTRDNESDRAHLPPIRLESIECRLFPGSLKSRSAGYERGLGIHTAGHGEIDGVIDRVDPRRWMVSLSGAEQIQPGRFRDSASADGQLVSPGPTAAAGVRPGAAAPQGEGGSPSSETHRVAAGAARGLAD
jgi:hypothetical protein